MISEGDRAPDFTLPGTTGDGYGSYWLSDMVADGPVVLAFYWFGRPDATPGQPALLRGAEWFTCAPGVDVFGISVRHSDLVGDCSVSADAQYPILNDTTGQVSERYGIPPQRSGEAGEAVVLHAVVIVDSDRRVRYTWWTGDSAERPHGEDIRATLAALRTPVTPPGEVP